MRNVNYRNPWTSVIVAIVLLGVVWALYGSVRNFDFVNLDDPVVVAENPMMHEGLSGKSFAWALRETGELNLWHPLTWMSHLAVAECFGVASGPHHLASVFLHMINALLVWMLLRKLTLSPMLSAVVALLFLVHPQRVEVVVWISSRKEILAATFVFLCLLAWIRARETSRGGWIVVAWLALVAALLSKPIAVVVPLLLPWIDHLLRSRGRSIPRQKWIWMPFWGAAVAVALITISLQQGGGHAELGEKLPLLRRLELMPVMFAHFIRQSLLPSGLQVFVPAPPEGMATLALAGIGCAIFVFLAVVAWYVRKSHPLVTFGFGWCLLFLLPVSGIVPVSIFLTADRYTYLPQLGFLLMLASWIAGMLRHRPRLTYLSTLATVCLAGIWSVQTQTRVRDWKDSVALFTAESDVNPNSLLAQIHLAAAHLAKGNAADALAAAHRAVAIQPTSGLAQVNVAEALRLQGDANGAIAAYRAAIQCGNLRKDTAWIHLAELLYQSGNDSEALATFDSALARSPKPSLALLLSAAEFHGFKRRDRDRPRALDLLSAALQLDPNSPTALRDSGLLQIESGQTAQGLEFLRAYLRMNPTDTGIQSLVGKLTSHP